MFLIQTLSFCLAFFLSLVEYIVFIGLYIYNSLSSLAMRLSLDDDESWVCKLSLVWLCCHWCGCVVIGVVVLSLVWLCCHWCGCVAIGVDAGVEASLWCCSQLSLIVVSLANNGQHNVTLNAVYIHYYGVTWKWYMSLRSGQADNESNNDDKDDDLFIYLLYRLIKRW